MEHSRCDRAPASAVGFEPRTEPSSDAHHAAKDVTDDGGVLCLRACERFSIGRTELAGGIVERSPARRGSLNELGGGLLLEKRSRSRSALEHVVHGRVVDGGAPMSCVASACRARALCACPVGIPSEHPPSPFRLHFPLRASPMARSAPLSVVERWTLLNITQHEGVAQGCLAWRILVLLAHLASYRSSELRRRKLITPSMMSAAAAELLAGKRSNSARRRILLDAASLRGPRRVVGDAEES